MVRMQVTLASDEHRRMRERARALGVSAAEYIRRVIAADLAGHERTDTDVAALTGLGNSGGSNVARHKQDYLAAAMQQARVPATE